ncbi:MAG: DUF6498-containing protein [Verrucomicrobiota bacterium]
MNLIEPLKNPAVWRSPSVLMLIAVNLIPLAGVLLFGWQVFPIMFLFWLENVVVGIFNVAKMLFACGPSSNVGVKIFLIPFFTVHYGIFTLVHGVFVCVMFGADWRSGGLGGGPFPSFERVQDLVMQQHLGWAVLGLVVSHGFSFLTNYVLNGDYRTVVAPVLMMQPYGRVVVLHLAILGGGFLVLLMGMPAIGLTLLIVLKICLDVLAHAKLHVLGGRPAKNIPSEIETRI